MMAKPTITTIPRKSVSLEQVIRPFNRDAPRPAPIPVPAPVPAEETVTFEWSASMPVETTTMEAQGVRVTYSTKDEEYDELSRIEHVERIENPDNPDQFLEVAVLDEVEVRSKTRRKHRFRYTPPVDE